jgi:hypothetical protein
VVLDFRYELLIGDIDTRTIENLFGSSLVLFGVREGETVFQLFKKGLMLKPIW